MYLGEVFQGKVVSVCEEALNQDKKASEISFNYFSLKISLSVKGKVKGNREFWAKGNPLSFSLA